MFSDGFRLGEVGGLRLLWALLWGLPWGFLWGLPWGLLWGSGGRRWGVCHKLRQERPHGGFMFRGDGEGDVFAGGGGGFQLFVEVDHVGIQDEVILSDGAVEVESLEGGATGECGIELAVGEASVSQVEFHLFQGESLGFVDGDGVGQFQGDLEEISHGVL